MSEIEKYGGPINNAAREKALYHAVERLTQYRNQSAVVGIHDFDRILSHVCDQLERADIFPVPHSQVADGAKAFRNLHLSRVGNKSPQDLMVLFLCGPYPSHDVTVLRDLGIPCANMWAIESDKHVFAQAVENLQDEGLPVRIYRSGLNQFLEVVPQQFDIVYFDSCSPLFGGDPNTINVIRDLFKHQRLAPLSVLITNFSEAGWSTKNSDWGKRLGAWTALRRTDSPLIEVDEYLSDVEDDIPEYYSDFITRFIVDFAGQLLPWWRAIALRGVQREMFSSEKALATALEAEDGFHQTLPGALFQESLVELRNISRLVSRRLSVDDPMRKLLFDSNIEQVKLKDAIELASFVRNYGSSMTEEQQGVFAAACSNEMKGVLNKFPWIDDQTSGPKIFTDYPGPHLLADLLFGVYGFSYHANLTQSQRWKYTAQDTPMYLDALVFDQARYFYDCAPTLPLFLDEIGNRFDMQVILRCCMDALFKHGRPVGSDLFHGATLVPDGSLGIPFHTMPERENITQE